MNRYKLNHNPRTDTSADLIKYERAISTIEGLYEKISAAYEGSPCGAKGWLLIKFPEGVFHIEKSDKGPSIFFMIDDTAVNPTVRIKISLTLKTVVTNTKPQLSKIIYETMVDGHAKAITRRQNDKEATKVTEIQGRHDIIDKFGVIHEDLI